MQAGDMILVSVDDHVVEPPDLFAHHLTDVWKSRAPRVVRKKDGSDVWYFEGQQLPNIGLNAVVGRPPEEYGVEPTSFDQLRPGTWNVHERIRDMNANGVLASLCFPSFPGFCGALWSRTKDKGVSQKMLRAYNDWHIHEWCGAYPGRFIPLALPPLWDPKAMAEEVRRVALLGCHAISFSENPEKLGLPSLHAEHWDPFWSACCDEGTIVCIHIGSGAGMTFTSMDAPVDVMITVQPINIVACAADLLWSHVLRKFPRLKIALSEGGIGWIPYFLERADYVYQHHRAWTHQDFGAKRPSDVFREQIVTCFIDDPIGIANRHAVGLDTITWECDYPHSDTTWPKSPERLAEQFVGVPDAEVNQITHENALRHFRLDPFAHVPKERCRVDALRALARDVDLSVSSKGGKPPSADRAKLVTSQDVVRQLATAFASAPE
jgi:predicted TIM-barrel fold metal-dependent hydrolase